MLEQLVQFATWCFLADMGNHECFVEKGRRSTREEVVMRITLDDGIDMDEDEVDPFDLMTALEIQRKFERRGRKKKNHDDSSLLFSDMLLREGEELEPHVMHDLLRTNDNRVSIIPSSSGGDQEFSCDVSGKRSLTTSTIKTDNNDDDERIECRLCRRTFSDVTKLTNHLTKFHAGIRPYSCSVCGSSFHKKADLLSHMTHVHPYQNEEDDIYNSDDVTTYYCDDCDKTFLTEVDYLSHQFNFHSHNDPEEEDPLADHLMTDDDHIHYNCPLCNDMFHSLSVLKAHMDTDHQDDTFFLEVGFNVNAK